MTIRCLSVLLVMLSLFGGTTLQAANLAALPGVVAVAESQHRDRWGVDGWHPWLVCDEQANTSWLSDNWEYTHTLVLIFPWQSTVQQVVINWHGGKAPVSFVVRTWQEGHWVNLKTVAPRSGETKSTVDLDPVSVTALAVCQPAGQANPGTDRRLGISELQVMGSPMEPPAAVKTAIVKTAILADLARYRQAEANQRVAPQLAVVMQKPKTIGFLALIDREDLARGRKNIATRPWAMRYYEGVVKDADWWLSQSDEYLYSLIPVGNPRAISPSFEKGCPLHGGARYTYTATLEKPYRWKCKRGGEEWYDGAVVKNPKTGADVIVHDDGNGWLAPEGFPNAGRRYYFTAAYRYYLLGKLLSTPYEGDGGSKYQGGTPVLQLSLAYAMTGEAKYAHKAAVILNRLAEVYRFFDGSVEGPSQRQDGYIGQTFERFLVENFILCCDLIWDEVGRDVELQRFFAAKGSADYNGDGKVDGSDFTYNIQRNLLGYVYEYLHRLMPYFDGDFIMYEMTALSALTACLNSPDLAEEVLHSDVGLRVMLTNEWFRDGKFIYDSTGYNLGNAQTPLQIAEWMHGFHVSSERTILPQLDEGKPVRLEAPPTKAGETDRWEKPLDLYNHPDYNMGMLFDFIRNVDCDGRVPQIGDVGGARNSILNTSPPYSKYDERGLLRLPGEREYYRQRLLAASHGDLESFREGRADYWLVFHAGPPEALRGSLVTAPVPTSHIFDDGGIAILRAGNKADSRVHVPFTFSKGSYAHGHPDKLAINLFRYGWDFSADLGYPTTWTDIKNGGWETNTASHCTVMVDERGQQGNAIGNLHYFASEPLFDVAEASAEAVYPQCSLYRRTVALVRDEDGEPLYVADIFRVTGGQTRDYLFHSLGKPENMSVTIDGAEPTWNKQAKGSLAGEDVAPMSKGGYGFLWDVQRTNGEGLIRATWQPTTGMPQFVLTMLGAPGREAIRATAEGYGVRGSAPLEGHLIVRDRPVDATAQSTFITVLEATNQAPRVRKIEAVEVSAEGDNPPAPGELAAFVVVTEGRDGKVRRDLIISNRSAQDWKGRSLKFGGKDVYFEGRFALLRELDGKLVTGMLAGGRKLAYDGKRLELPGTFHGHIMSANTEKNAIAVKVDKGSQVPTKDFVGRKLIVRNPAYGYVSVYTIEQVEALGGGLYRLLLNLPLVVARGVIDTVDAATGAFASQTPVMKLRVNPGLFDGKVVRTSAAGREWRLKSAAEGAFMPLDARALAEFPAGGSYVVFDLGVGDTVEVVLSGVMKY